MSVQTVKKVRKVTNFSLLNAVYMESVAGKFKLNPACFLVLIGLVNHYNPDKSIVFPSQEYLAGHLNLSERTVVRAINELTSKGLIFKSKKGNSNVYCFTRIFFDAVRMSDSGCQDVGKVGVRMSGKHDNYKYINNIVDFNKKGKEPEAQRFPGVEETKEYLEEQQKVTMGSPLDFSKEEAFEWLKNLPVFAQNGFFATELRRKWGFEVSSGEQ